MAAGRPVIAYKRGGATETVIAGKTGLFFSEATGEAISAVIKNFRSADFDPIAIRQHAEQFSVENFKRRINDFILKNYQPKL